MFFVKAVVDRVFGLVAVLQRGIRIFNCIGLVDLSNFVSCESFKSVSEGKL